MTAAREADRSWMDDAACRGADPDDWYPVAGKPSPHALAVCARCPVREACADYATAIDERHGVWGGLTNEQRNRRARQKELTSHG